MENEIWKDITGYDGVYQVSDMGRVKRLIGYRCRKERILKTFDNGNGYPFVVLCKDGVSKEYYVHRLVAEAFLPNPNNLPCVNHINEVKTDNRSENLEYCDHAYNNSYGNRITRIAKSMTNGKLSKSILQYSLDGDFIKEYPSANEVERQLGFSQGNISKCCLGKYKQMYGYKWHYKQTKNK